MNRRNFFSTMIGGVATAAAVRTWPFRVYSFPAEPKVPCIGYQDLPPTQWMGLERIYYPLELGNIHAALRTLRRNGVFPALYESGVAQVRFEEFKV